MAEQVENIIIEDPEALKRQSGFELGWTPESILATVHNSESILYVVKWQGKPIAEPVESEVLLEKAPNLLLDFLERHLVCK